MLAYPIVSNLLPWYPVLSCLTLSYHVLSCLVLSDHMDLSIYLPINRIYPIFPIYLSVHSLSIVYILSI